MSSYENDTSMGIRVEQTPHGTHMCYIYSDDNERRQVLARFLESGLSQGELVTYIADKATPNEVAEYLKETGIDLSKVSRDDQLLTLCADSTYCPNGYFSMQEMLDRNANRYKMSIAKGFTSARAASEMDWALKGYPGSDQVAEYEARGGIPVKETGRTVMCLYDARRFDGATLYEILKVHPMMLARGMVVYNPYYLTLDEYLEEHSGRQ